MNNTLSFQKTNDWRGKEKRMIKSEPELKASRFAFYCLLLKNVLGCCKWRVKRIFEMKSQRSRMLAICDMYHSFLLVSVVFFLSCNLCLTDSFYLFSMKWKLWLSCLLWFNYVYANETASWTRKNRTGLDSVPPKKIIIKKKNIIVQYLHGTCIHNV